MISCRWARCLRLTYFLLPRQGRDFKHVTDQGAVVAAALAGRQLHGADVSGISIQAEALKLAHSMARHVET